MEGDLIKIRHSLKPLSWLYGLGVALRNTLFDWHVLKEKSYQIPVINVGNLTVGGTGKTPHTEYLLDVLQKHYKVAVLSRGYKRKTSGYHLATPESTMQEIGDESWQMKQKFPDAYVAVDGNRRRGIEHLCNDAQTKDVEVILLDDAYQHRYVKPGINILLVDYHRMITDDALLPAGRLREPAKGKQRANIVIVTKCPADIKPIGFRVIMKSLNLRPYQKLYFSTFRYGKLKPLFTDEQELALDKIDREQHILLLTGIGSPEQMTMDLRRYSQHIKPLSYPDHHFFNADDVEKINDTLRSMPKPRMIITTEKDAARLRQAKGLSEETRQGLYVLPIHVEIMQGQQEEFNDKITGYVLKNSRNSILAKGKNHN